MIHGMKATYNDIQPWNHIGLLNVFGADSSNSKSYQCESRTALENLLKDEKFSSAPYIQVCPCWWWWLGMRVSGGANGYL